MTKNFISELNENYKLITGVYRSLGESAEKGVRVVAAAEWLLDNYYIIERQIKDIRSGFTSKVSGRLVKLHDGNIRIYRLAQDIVEGCTTRLDEEYIIHSVMEYQKMQVLETTELWALPVMLKAAIICKIRKLCERVGVSQQSYKTAMEVALRLEKGETPDILKKYINAGKFLDHSFIEYLVYCLKRKGGANSSYLAEVDKLLAVLETGVEKIVEEEYEKQARRQIVMGNFITSLSSVSAVDWTGAFDRLSRVEELLRGDPSGIYPKMDFESRDYYRKTVESLSKQLKTDDLTIVKKAVELAGESVENPKKGHVGYYLIDKGKHELYVAIGSEKEPLNRLRELLKNNSVSLYIGVSLLLSLAFSAGLGLLYNSWPVFILALLPISHIVISSLNFVLSHFIQPALLPKMELEEGILPENATLAVVPTLIPDPQRAIDIIDNLEAYYLSNKQDNLYFAVAGDFKDAPQKHTPQDRKILMAAFAKINELNEKYANGKDIFYFFQRRRDYNQIQNRWMGWERKRGALLELNELLRGSKNTSYTHIAGDIKTLPHIRFVLTLDADTRLPMDTAKKLVGTMLHPLNRPKIDSKRGIVTEGYGILQPKVSVDIESANKTYFSRIFAGQGGIDPYSTVVSDIYQDIFGESIFTGKGIFEVDVFNTVLKDSIPENTILSHDLLEGSYIRCGLVGDVELVDGYPARYNSYSLRQHRWLRGDWQLLFWLLPHIRNRGGKLTENPLTVISRFKIWDNLRRSLMPIAQLILIIAGFYLPYGGSLIALSLLSIAFAVITYLIEGIIQNNLAYVGQRQHSTIIYGFRGALYQAGLLFAFLPHQAWISFDAILRTLIRVFITHKNMLEWVTAADAERSLKNNLASYYKRMLFSPSVAIFIIYLSYKYTPWLLGYSIILGIGWLIAPYIGYIISKPIVEKVYKLTEEDIKFLRRIARKTWRYFEDFTLPQYGYIPPDNYQENPPNGAALRTSPTNIGLTLVSILTAYDLGYITRTLFLEQIKAIMDTIQGLDKWNGHLYNWYETKGFKILRPAYVSTVDSGNFAGYLMVLKQGLEGIKSESGLSYKLILGIKDLLGLLEEEGIKVDIKVPENITKDISSEIITEAVSELLERLYTIKVKTPWLNKLKDMCEEIIREAAIGEQAKEYNEICNELINTIEGLLEGMSFEPLYCKKRGLFSIGFNVEEGKLTNSFYDLLASEARQASFIAIARGHVPVKHWFKMGRSLTMYNGYKGLASWSGTMFEYFMPLLIIKNIKNTLLDETYNFVMDSQIRYGKKRSVPWGVSESGFAAFDMQLNYQYKAFGVPELGFKRGLTDDTVIAPYASVMALMQKPLSAINNLKRLKELGVEGNYGYYEAVDYTPERQLRGRKHTIVKSYMVHHVGMSMMALANVLYNNIMQQRFHALPEVKATEYLLHERVPVRVIITNENNQKTKPIKDIEFIYQSCCREFKAPEQQLPNVHLLSNSTFCTMVDDLGRGYSKSNRVMLSRFREEAQKGNYGTFFYIRNTEKGNWWTATPAPAGTAVKGYRAVFTSHKAEFTRENDNIVTNTEICVSPEDSIEVRILTFKNRGEKDIVLEITSYIEPSIFEQEADVAHPAFGKLFIRTEYLGQYSGLLAERRPRSEGSEPIWLLHKLISPTGSLGEVQYETDRARFIGRNRNLSTPQVLEADMPLSNSTGAVIDPILSLRCRITVPAGGVEKVCYITGSHTNKEEILSLCNKYNAYSSLEGVFELALTRSRVVNKYLAISQKDEEFFQRLLSHMIYLSPLRLKDAVAISSNTKGQQALWRYGISGDLPMITYIVNRKEDFEVLERLLKAHEYWRLRGFACDFAILSNEEMGYNQALYSGINDVISGSHARELIDRRGGIYVRKIHAMEQGDLELFITASKIVLRGDDIERQLKINKEDLLPPYKSFSKKAVYADEHVELPKLMYHNGYGGFNVENGEYVMELKEWKTTPLPWINVISNMRFGFLVSESGGGHAWSQNSREYKLTPWTNDFVTDPPGEAIYIRDENDGEVWTVTPLPLKDNGQYIIRHGFGYSSFNHNRHGTKCELTMLVPEQDTVKLSILRIKNSSGVSRKFTAVYFAHPVLGVSEYYTKPYIITEYDGRALYARNAYINEYTNHMMFMCSSIHPTAFSGNFNEFQTSMPDALLRERLSNVTGAGKNAAMALQVSFELEPNEQKDIVFMLGTGQHKEHVHTLIEKYNSSVNALAALERVKQYWQDVLGVIKVKTPEPSMDIMLNGRLVYQTLACRIWARSAFYQSGGAFGFRDQLQDSASLVYSLPELTAAQILRHASRQFEEGDVQHWWHTDPENPSGASRGIRTRFSDDLVWLPYITADYIEKTGDYSILDFEAPFISDHPLKEGEDERYSVPITSEKLSTVYEHCCLALDKALKYGEHGIPLMGCGDWNDGMNMVGNKGKGESVWLAFFLYATLKQFIPISKKRGNMKKASEYERAATGIAQAIEKHGWDGSWYRRAYFDDGTPLGSSQNSECKIDSIAQSWAVISEAANKQRMQIAMQAVERYLIKSDEGLVLLLYPPFDNRELKPGYIRAYIPGVRENGGQYTHAAAWVVLAYAKLGMGDKAVWLYNMLNPVNHSRTSIETAIYKAEPYAVAADIYNGGSNTGRGGWTWYTGAAGWLYKVGLESILGFVKKGDILEIKPCIDASWQEYSIEYRYKSSVYEITIKNPDRKNTGVKMVSIDGNPADKRFKLEDDGKHHVVEVVM